MHHSFIYSSVSLAEKTWFKTGGPARFYAEPVSEIEFQQALTFASNNQLPIFILGEGANILISDEGFDGLVIRPQLKHITIQELTQDQRLVFAEAGVSMQTLINFCLDQNVVGLEEFSGIPGTVGGSMYINLHYFEFLLEHFLHNARVINKKTGEIKTVNPDWFNFGYNQSRLHEEEFYLLSATFKLTKAPDIKTAYARGRSVEIIRHRNKRYPTQATCGSFFRNFYENEVALIENKKKVIFVAYYLDKIGVKGQLTLGNARVSYQHANMIINMGGATTQNITDLASKMQELVQKEFGILPQPECRLIGFKKYPLLK